MFKISQIKFVLIFSCLAFQVFIVQGQHCGNEGGQLTVFNRYKQIEINDVKNLSLIREYKVNKMICATMCQLNCSCFAVHTRNNDICRLHDKRAMEYLVDKIVKENEFIFVKKNLREISHDYKSTQFTEGLVHFWSFGESLIDVIGGRNITKTEKAKAVNDRHGNRNSAFELNLGYVQFPVGYYFYPEFTYMIWVKTISYNSWQRVIDFGDGPKIKNFFIGHVLSTGNVGLFLDGLEINSDNVAYPLNEWVHVALTSKTKTVLYTNGVKTYELDRTMPTVLETANNYVGKSQYTADSNIHAVVDDFKIFNRALTVQEIMNEKDKTYEKTSFKLLHVKSSKSVSSGLVNYWPMAGSLRDILGGKDMIIKENGELTTDRFGNKNSAVIFNNGYGEIPMGQFLKQSAFTVMIWVKILSYENFKSIFDFGLNQNKEKRLTISIDGASGFPMIYYDEQFVVTIQKEISNFIWNHLAITFENNEIRFYVNSVLENTSALTISDSLQMINYLGKSVSLSGSKIHAIIDEFKIFDRSLTVEEITFEKDIIQPYNIIEN